MLRRSLVGATKQAVRPRAPLHEQVVIGFIRLNSTSTAPTADLPDLPPCRIFLLPLSRKTPSSPLVDTTGEPLLYWHVSQQLPKSKKKKRKTDTAGSDVAEASKGGMFDALNGLDLQKPATWPGWAIEKASSIWLSWGTPPPGHPDASKPSGAATGTEVASAPKRSRTKEMQYWIWRNGERLMDRIAFEEWALKMIHPSVSPFPKVANIESGAEQSEVEAAEFKSTAVDTSARIPLYVPPGSIASTLGIPANHSLIQNLTTDLTERIPRHRSLFYRSLFLLPVLAPIGLLPVVPNLPAFYVVWRAWSHYKAWKGGEWLLDLAQKGSFEVKESETIGRALKAPGSDSESSGPEADIYLPAGNVDTLAAELRFAPAEIVDVKRAVAQASLRLRKQREKLEAQK